MRIRFVGLCFILAGYFLTPVVSAQSNRIKVLSWNILNWPSTSNIVSDTSTRCPAYRAVIAHAMPDIVMTCENNGFIGVPWFRDQVLIPATGYSFRHGFFVNGYDSDNAIYYRDSLFDFVYNQPITTSLRDINQFTLVYKPSGDTIILYMCHLKAGIGFEPDRSAEVSNLRAVTNSHPPGTNFLIGGDFNIYSSSESAYQSLIQNTGGEGHFNDVITGMSGVWNNSFYAPYHTQSTRTSTGPGGGSTGGMDDRFDMILMSNALIQSGGVTFIPGTYTSIGNDGNHYNQALNNGFNSVVPVSVANALHDASDHLPVMVTLQMSPVSGIADGASAIGELNVYPLPLSNRGAPDIFYSLNQPGNVTFTLHDMSGRLLWKKNIGGQGKGDFTIHPDDFPALSPGVYFLLLNSDKGLKSSRITVSN